MELSKTLTYIRRPYLNIEATNFHLTHSSRSFNLNDSSQQFSAIKYFNEAERGQIDSQLGVIASSLSKRINDLEAVEKNLIAAHHVGILWYLNHRLSQVNRTMKDIQEERLRRQEEITKTLGAGASKEVSAWQNQNRSSNSEGDNDGTRWSTLASNIASTITNSYGPSRPAHDIGKYKSEESIYRYNEDKEYGELSPSQVLLFEQENSDMLQSMRDTLASVQQAEARLLDISALQLQLITHLAQQAQITEQLYDDAITTTSMVEKGNTQLIEAKRRLKDSRLFLLVFLFGASFALLFVHFY
ncbi:hypothetical protein Clacol_001632 [Clathrus columnatus]|uniref:Syntaxin-18 n=1 Tax=Clathrus columnatus TaxID=1419009 RepID=A0AAV5A357_9AGAM|nr:hypothetical protein Clacol_001632 [Clathrus columnatus]